MFITEVFWSMSEPSGFFLYESIEVSFMEVLVNLHHGDQFGLNKISE